LANAICLHLMTARRGPSAHRDSNERSPRRSSPLWRRLQTIHHEIKESRYPNATSLAAALDVSTKGLCAERSKSLLS
jgi:hypothetical protein